MSALIVGSPTQHLLPTTQRRVKVNFEGVKPSAYSCQEIVDAPVNLLLKEADVSSVLRSSIDIYVRPRLKMLSQEIVPEDGVSLARFEGVGKQEAGREGPQHPKKERRVSSAPVARPVLWSLHLSGLHDLGFVIPQILLATVWTNEKRENVPHEGGSSTPQEHTDLSRSVPPEVRVGSLASLCTTSLQLSII